MKKVLLMLALSCWGWSCTASAETFENIGVIAEVTLGSNLIKVDSELFYLPSSVVVEGGKEAILTVQPGYLVGFSGRLARPHARIDSLFVYPESIQQAEENLRLLNEAQ